MINLRRILVPTDFSEHSKNALRYAAAFADKFGAEVFLLHVFQDLAIFQPDAVTVAPQAPPPIEQMLAAARTALERSIQEGPCAAVKVHPEVSEGSTFEEIVRFAKEKDIDLIIMGTHGRGWLAHVLLGSVTEKVVRKAPCPVLTVRHPEHEFVDEN
jgi:nucleotide-binding universal stress UspA family protein